MTMKVDKTAKYTFSDRKLSVDDLAGIVATAREMNATEVDINQTSYSDGPYGSTSTYITIEQGPEYVRPDRVSQYD
jgi:hypothetical protein